MILLIAALGLLQGPVLHRWAVAVGADRPLRTGAGNGPLQANVRGWRWRELGTSLLVGLAYWGMANTFGLTPVLVAHLVMVSLTAMLVVTDLAWPHIGGVRYWVANGVPIITHRMSRSFLEEVINRRWTLKPDLLEQRRASTKVNMRVSCGEEMDRPPTRFLRTDPEASTLRESRSLCRNRRVS